LSPLSDGFKSFCSTNLSREFQFASEVRSKKAYV